MKSIAKRLGVSRSTLYRWLDRYSGFSIAVENGKALRYRFDNTDWPEEVKRLQKEMDQKMEELIRSMRK